MESLSLPLCQERDVLPTPKQAPRVRLAEPGRHQLPTSQGCHKPPPKLNL